MRIETDTTKYEYSHGKKPRGYGEWGFEVTAMRGSGYCDIKKWERGNFGEAKAAAIRSVKDELGGGATVLRVTVLP